MRGVERRDWNHVGIKPNQNQNRMSHSRKLVEELDQQEEKSDVEVMRSWP